MFDAWSIDERILRGRARYAYDFSRTRRRPERLALFGALTSRLSEAGFAARSVTGAVEDALTTLGLGSWPAIGECGEGTGEADTPAAEKESWRSRVDRRVSRLVQARIRKTFEGHSNINLPSGYDHPRLASLPLEFFADDAAAPWPFRLASTLRGCAAPRRPAVFRRADSPDDDATLSIP